MPPISFTMAFFFLFDSLKEIEEYLKYLDDIQNYTIPLHRHLVALSLSLRVNVVLGVKPS